MTKIFVTGATGFVAQHLIHQLLEKDYRVVGSVRSTEKGEKLSSLFNNEKLQYEIVKDLANSREDFDKALRKHPDIGFVLHTASPVFPSDLKDIEQDMILPAINGTRNILLSIQENGHSVKKFVYTSSLAAVRSEQSYSKDEVVTEKTWNKISLNEAKSDIGLAYEASKTHGEKQVWNFFENNEVNFGFTIINPVYIFGPQLFDYYVKKQLNYSNEIINSLLKKEDKHIAGYQIDVRDVARAHIVAIENSNTSCKRLILADVPYNEQTLLDIINKNFPDKTVAVGEPGSDEKFFKEYYTLDNSKTKEILDFEFITQEKTIIDTVSQILAVSQKNL